MVHDGQVQHGSDPVQVRGERGVLPARGEVAARMVVDQQQSGGLDLECAEDDPAVWHGDLADRALREHVVGDHAAEQVEEDDAEALPARVGHLPDEERLQRGVVLEQPVAVDPARKEVGDGVGDRVQAAQRLPVAAGVEAALAMRRERRVDGAEGADQGGRGPTRPRSAP